MNLPAAALLLPLDIKIDPNSNGLPGIGQLKQHRRRLDDGRADPRRTRPDHLRDRVGARRELVATRTSRAAASSAYSSPSAPRSSAAPR